LTAADIDGFLDFFLQSSNLVPSVLLNRPGLNDPDDEFVMDLALQRRAAIVTYNKRDFAEAVKRGVAVLTPREFLEPLRQAK
jgi:predicted nucleic acid-binding protein